MRKIKFFSVLLVLVMLLTPTSTALAMILSFETNTTSVNGQTLLVTVEKATGEPVYIGKAQVNNGLVTVELPDDLVASTLVMQASTDNGVSIPFSVSFNNSDISPTTASFVQGSASDITVTMVLKGNTLNGLKNGDTNLTLNTHYTVSGNTVVIKREYLSSLAAGQANITFDFSGGLDRTLVLTISAPYSPSIIIETPPDKPKEEPKEDSVQTDNVTPTEQDVIDNIGKQITSELPPANTSSSANPTAVTGAADKITESINQAANNITTGAAAAELGKNLITVISSLNQAAASATTNTAKATVAESAGKALNTSIVLISKVDTAEQAVALAKDVINTTAAVKNTNAAIEQKVVEVAQKAVEKAGTSQVDSKNVVVAGAVAKATIDQQAVNAIVAKIDSVVKTASDMKSTLATNDVKASKEIEKVLTIKVQASPGVEKSDVDLPKTVFTAAAEKSISKVTVDTGIASFSIPPDAISTTGSQNVSLSSSVVDKSDLPAAVRTAVGDNPVFDFNLSVGSESVNLTKTNKAIDIKIPYQQRADEDPEKITVYYVNDQGVLENVIGSYDSSTGTVRFTAKHFSKYMVKYNPKEFADLSGFSWAEKQIESLASKGVISGRTDLNFDPGADITRAEFASLLAKMLKLNGDAKALPFTDVAANAWYAEGVAAAYANGIVQGKGASKFDPNGKITRQEMAAMINKVLVSQGYFAAPNTELNIFKDVAIIPAWARPGVAMAVREGIVRGMNEGYFMPEAYANRAQAAAMLYQLFNK